MADVDTSALERLGQEPLDWRAKGFPLDSRFPSAEHVRAATPLLFEDGFVTPVATLHGEALEHNIATMARYCADRGVQLAPHGKTTMAPQLFQQQIEHGAWGITAATPWQVRVCRQFGVERVLLANELTDPHALQWAAREYSAGPAQLLSYVDDADEVRRAEQLLEGVRPERPLEVLVELGVEGGRTGCRDDEAVAEVVRAVTASRHHRLVGVAGYEGVFGLDPAGPVTESVRDFMRWMRTVADRLVQEGAFPGREPVVLSAGGSGFFDVVVDELTGDLPGGRAATVIVRSGAYASHDVGLYGEVSPFRRRPELIDHRDPFVDAVEVWTRVLSRPEPGRAYVDGGKRDYPTDIALPTPRRVRRGQHVGPAPDRWRLTAANDQHGFLEISADDALAPGDWVSFGISHPCTFFDKWTWLPVVDDRDRVVDVIRTFF